MLSKTLLTLSAVLLCAQAQATCFTLISPDNRTVYQSNTPPFDLSRPLSQSLAAQYPSHHLVIADTNDCPVVDVRPETVARNTLGTSKSVVESAVFRNAREIGDLTEAEMRQAAGALPSTSRRRR